MNELEILEVAVTWLDFASSAVLVGGAAYAALVATPEGAGRCALRWSVLVLAVALSLEIGLNALRMYLFSGVGGMTLLSDVLEMRWSRLWIVRSLGLAVIGLLLTFRKPPWRILAVSALGWLMTRSFQGHAGAHGTVLAVADWIHLSGASVWLGGLFQFLLCPNPLTGTAARRISQLATACVALVVPTGIYAAFLHVPSLDALLGTAYGRTLIFKVALAILLLVSGAANHFLHIPRLDRGEPEAAPRLMQTVRRELAVGGLLLGITGLLVSLPMPHEVEPNTAIQVSLDPAVTRTQNMPESGTSP